MPDVFSNLVAQSLSSSVGIQPLVAPLFAPAPLLVSDATLPLSNDQAAVAAEAAPFSIAPAMFANATTASFEIEQPFQQTIAREQQTILPDLVPLAVQHQPLSIVSLRHLFHPQHPAKDKMEPALPTSQSTVPAPTVDEPASEDASYPFYLSQDHPVMTEASGQPLSLTSIPSPQPSFQSQDVGKNDDVRDRQSLSTVQPLVQPIPNSRQRDQLVVPAAEREHHNPPEPTSGDNQSGSQADISSWSLHRTDETASKAPLGQDAHQLRSRGERGEEVRRGTLWPPTITPDVSSITQPPLLPLVMPAQAMTPAIVTPASLETPQAANSMNRIIESTASTASAELAERLSMHSLLHSSTVADIKDATIISPQQEAEIPEEVLEVPPIRITIGRIVVRATPTAQPAPNQKRVLRPAQSLSEYLKQRERGSR